jgi:hypothetical protein
LISDNNKLLDDLKEQHEKTVEDMSVKAKEAEGLS